LTFLKMQIGRGLNAKGHKDNYATPAYLYEELDKEFQFDHDPCGLNPLGLREIDGLGEWGKRNWVNPPYSKKIPWIQKAIEEQRKGKLTVMLLPVDTSTSWFLDMVLPNAEVRWIRGRLKFGKTHAAYASMLAIFRPRTVLDRLEQIQP
jgi:hypothetical protein